MSTKIFLVFCVQTVLLQFVQSQCTHSAIITASSHTYISTTVSPSPVSPFSTYGCPELIAPAIKVTPTSGGALPVTCLSSFPEEPLIVTSENVYEGNLSVNGDLPFVSSVSVSGELPTAGTGAVNHACGSNVILNKELYRSIGNSVVPTNAIASNFAHKPVKAPEDPSLAVAENFDTKRGLGSRFSSLGYVDSTAACLGLVNSLGAALGLGNVRYNSNGIGRSKFCAADIGNLVNAVGDIEFNGADVGSVEYSSNAIGNVGMSGVMSDKSLNIVGNIGLNGARLNNAYSIGNIGFNEANIGAIRNAANGIRITGYERAGVINAGYGGTGEGNIAIVGEVPVAGTTVVVGQLPIVGIVYFNGNAPACGSVTVSGSCLCEELRNKY